MLTQVFEVRAHLAMISKRPERAILCHFFHIWILKPNVLYRVIRGKRGLDRRRIGYLERHEERRK